MENFFFSPISLAEVKQEVTAIIQAELQKHFSTQTALQKQMAYLSRKQAKDLLGISYPTLSAWTKAGVIKGYRIGSSTRVRYKEHEIEAALIGIKTTGGK